MYGEYQPQDEETVEVAPPSLGKRIALAIRALTRTRSRTSNHRSLPSGSTTTAALTRTGSSMPLVPTGAWFAAMRATACPPRRARRSASAAS